MSGSLKNSLNCISLHLSQNQNVLHNLSLYFGQSSTTILLSERMVSLTCQIERVGIFTAFITHQPLYSHSGPDDTLFTDRWNQAHHRVEKRFQLPWSLVPFLLSLIQRKQPSCTLTEKKIIFLPNQLDA